MNFPTRIPAYVLWALQLLLAAVILGLSVDRVRSQVYGSAPTTDQYSVFTGVFGFLVSVAGIISVLYEVFPLIAILAVDLLCGIFFLAGGIAFSIGLRGVDCGAADQDSFLNLANSDLVNLGRIEIHGQTAYGFKSVDQLRDLCRRAVADETVSYLAAVFALLTMAVMFFHRRRSSGGAFV